MDGPRFERVAGKHDELHRSYHGGRLVDFVFSIVDAWHLGRVHPSHRLSIPPESFLKRFPQTLATSTPSRDSPSA